MVTNNSTDQNLWKAAKWGVLTFCVIHFFYEMLVDNSKSAGLMVIVNFWVSRWYIKEQIKKGKISNNLFLWGLSVAGIVFLLRTILGLLIFSLFTL